MQDVRRARVRQRQDRRQHRTQHQHADTEQGRALEDRLEDLGQVLLREHALHALHRIDALHLRHQALEREQRANLQKVGGNADHAGEYQQRQHRPHQQHEIKLQGIQQIGRAMPADPDEAGFEGVRQMLVDPAGQQRRHRQPQHQQQRVGEFLAAMDLAFLACVLEPFRGRLFGLIAAFGLAHEYPLGVSSSQDHGTATGGFPAGIG